jgi:hypothetical protein
LKSLVAECGGYPHKDNVIYNMDAAENNGAYRADVKVGMSFDSCQKASSKRSCRKLIPQPHWPPGNLAQVQAAVYYNLPSACAAASLFDALNWFQPSGLHQMHESPEIPPLSCPWYAQEGAKQLRIGSMHSVEWRFLPISPE